MLSVAAVIALARAFGGGVWSGYFSSREIDLAGYC